MVILDLDDYFLHKNLNKILMHVFFRSYMLHLPYEEK